MTDYRLYCLDGTRRIARAAEVIRADGDDQAVRAARALRMPVACELWQGKRLVATVPATKRPGPASRGAARPPAPRTRA